MVEPGVLLEVLDLVAHVGIPLGVRRVGLTQTGDDLVRRIVRVDLVAEQQQKLGPLVLRRRDHALGKRNQCVGAQFLEVLVIERCRAAAAAKRKAKRRVRVRCADDAGRELGIGGWPNVLAVEANAVLVARVLT